jgi:hypothetical protein
VRAVHYTTPTLAKNARSYVMKTTSHDKKKSDLPSSRRIINRTRNEKTKSSLCDASFYILDDFQKVRSLNFPHSPNAFFFFFQTTKENSRRDSGGEFEMTESYYKNIKS